MTPARFSLPDDGLAAARLCLAQRMPAGDPVRLRAVAYRSGAFAAELRHSAAVLLATAETGLWRGPAHRAFTEQLRTQAPCVTATADRYDGYASALAGYAGALEEIGAPLAALRRQLQQSSDELSRRPGAGSDRTAGLLPLARAFKDRYDQWADALDRCTRALLRTGEHDPTRDLHGWRAFSHQVGQVAAAAAGTFERAVLHPSLHNISACLGELNAGLSVLGLGLLFIYPPAGAACLAAATVLAVAQLAVDAARRAHGEQVSNASLGFELAAAIPVGGSALRSLKAADNVVHLVPGGGLAAHEAAGGHTLARHVGKPESYLHHRLATEPHITAASTFYNREIAEGSIATVMKANQRTIERWQASRERVLILDGMSPEPVGVLIPRGSTSSTVAHSIKIILKRNHESRSGYLLFTAMVTE
jgi:uncharacterized protein YukE